jgi:hypothetical protein
MKNLTCDKVVADLDAFRDGILDEQQVSLIDQHLVGCYRCREQKQNLDDLDSTISSQADDWQPDDRLWERIQASAASDKVKSSKHHQIPFKRFNAIAALILLVVVTVTLSISLTSQQVGNDQNFVAEV